MLTALDSKNKKCIAWNSNKNDKPYFCQECKEQVTLKKGNKNIHHFAHKAPVNCSFGTGESQKHYNVKKQIYETLLKEPNCSKCELERVLDGVRPDISLKINNSYVAIEVQKSNIDFRTIIQRFERYKKLNINLIWIMPDSHPKIVSQDKKDNSCIKNICRPKEWEKYLHAMNYGRIYYWQNNAKVKAIHFGAYQYEVESGNWVEENDDLDSLQGTDWYNENFDNANYGGYTK